MQLQMSFFANSYSVWKSDTLEQLEQKLSCGIAEVISAGFSRPLTSVSAAAVMSVLISLLLIEGAGLCVCVSMLSDVS